MKVDVGPKKLTDKFTFGKYKGNLIEDVINDNPSYVTWVLANVEWFALDQEAIELLKKRNKAKAKKPHSAPPYDEDEDDDDWGTGGMHNYLDGD